MAENNAVKGLGLLAIMGLFFAKTCKTCIHESSTVIHQTEEVATHTKIRPHESFSCNRPHIQEEVHIDPPSVVDDVSDEAKKLNGEDGNFLKKDFEGNFSYSDGTAATFKSLNEINFDNSKVLIVDGNLTEDEIKTLNKKGVKFICNKDIYEKQKSITKYQIILIFSEDRNTLKNLYGVSEEQVDDVIKMAQPVLDDINITPVNSKENLDKVLASFYERKITPVIVFNNKNKTLFDYPLWHYGISNAITCNSYNLGTKLFFSSTSYIGIDHVLKSLKNNHQSTLFDFYKNFSTNYATELYNEKKYLVTVVATSTLAIGSSAGYIVYYNLNKDS